MKKYKVSSKNVLQVDLTNDRTELQKSNQKYYEKDFSFFLYSKNKNYNFLIILEKILTSN